MSAAELELRAALKANPAYLPAWQNLANLQEDLGRRDEARESYEQILKREPQAVRGAGALLAALQRDLAQRSADRAPARSPCQCRGGCRQPREPRLRPRPRSSMPAGSTRRPLRRPTRANADSRASVTPPVHYDRAAQERLVDELIRAFPKARRHPRDTGTGRPRPIFICGMFRSGSTLTEQLLAGHPRSPRAASWTCCRSSCGRSLRALSAVRAAWSRTRRSRALAAQYRAELARRFPAGSAGDGQAPGQLHLSGSHQAAVPAGAHHPYDARPARHVTVHLLPAPRPAPALRAGSEGHRSLLRPVPAPHGALARALRRGHPGFQLRYAGARPAPRGGAAARNSAICPGTRRVLSSRRARQREDRERVAGARSRFTSTPRVAPITMPASSRRWPRSSNEPRNHDLDDPQHPATDLRDPVRLRVGCAARRV